RQSRNRLRCSRAGRGVWPRQLPPRRRNAHMGPMIETSGALVLFSGGQDSAGCLAWALERYDRVETVGFDYGQRHSVELKARDAVREAIVARFPASAARLGEDHVLDLRGFGAGSQISRHADRAI